MGKAERRLQRLADQARKAHQARDYAIRQAAAEGLSYRQIAAATGLSHQRVAQIVKGE